MTPAAAAAVSGLAASTAALDASASNVANAQTFGPLAGSGWGPAATVGSAGSGLAAGTAYQPVTAVPYATAAGGVATRLAAVSPATEPAYDPQSPYADDQGLVAEPNVDLDQERVGQMGALSTFQANLAVLRVSDEMQKRLLAIA